MMIRPRTIRKASLTALAGAVGLLAVSPGWSSCPPMGGRPVSQGGNPGSGGGDTGAANAMRQEAGDLAGQGSNNGGSTSSGGSGDTSLASDVFGQIDALGAAQSANDAAAAQVQQDAAAASQQNLASQNQVAPSSLDVFSPASQVLESVHVAECQRLTELLASLQSDPALTSNVASLTLGDISGPGPGAIDYYIQTHQSALDEINAQRLALAKKSNRPPVLAQDPFLDWLLRYKTALLSGIGVQEARDAFAGNAAAASRQYRAVYDQIQDVKGQIGAQRCQ